jgi:hypothetical protein
MGKAMGILDHRKTWQFQVRAAPEDCVAAFIKAFSGPGGGGLLTKAKWDVHRTDNGAVAVYRGRAGLMKGATMLSSTATSVEDAAKGSEVTFAIKDSANGAATCAMWLSTVSTTIGFTNDGRFFRPYMRTVEGHLRQLDPGLGVAKA